MGNDTAEGRQPQNVHHASDRTFDSDKDSGSPVGYGPHFHLLLVT
jgi:hypothetical protein